MKESLEYAKTDTTFIHIYIAAWDGIYTYIYMAWHQSPHIKYLLKSNFVKYSKEIRMKISSLMQERKVYFHNKSKLIGKKLCKLCKLEFIEKKIVQLQYR